MSNHSNIRSRGGTRPSYTRAELENQRKRALAQAPDTVDTSDIPPTTPEQWATARLVVPAKKQISIRLDEDVLAWFKAQEGAYQTRINAVLRTYMEAQTAR